MTNKTKTQKTIAIDHEVVAAQVNQDIKTAVFIVSLSFNVAMLSIWIGLQMAMTTV